jgi:catechol-2,3-dioxygenase
VSDQQIQRVKVGRLAHVGIWTTDVAAQARFYHQVAGLGVRATSTGDIELEDANVFLTVRDEQPCLGLFNDVRSSSGNGRRSAPRTRLNHLSFEVDTDAELAALAARLKMAGIDLTLGPRDAEPDLGDTLWLNDPDGNRIEIVVATDDLLSTSSPSRGRQMALSPISLQHVALRTPHLEEMVEFYTEALGFDISDWLLRESVWLRCNSDHHTVILSQGKPEVEHIGFSITDGSELLLWADYLGHQQVPVVWGPGRHGAGNDLFLRFADPEGLHIELSAGLQQYYDRDVTTPPRLWHTRSSALNLWGVMPSWLLEEAQV